MSDDPTAPENTITPTSGPVRVLRLLLAASLVAPALLFAAAAWQDRHVRLEEASRRSERAVQVLEQHAASAFHTYELVFARIDEHLRATGPSATEADLHAYLASIDRELKEVGSLFVVDADGRVVAHSRHYPVPPASVADRDYYRALAPHPDANPSSDAVGTVGDKGLLAVGAPATGRFSGAPKLNIARAHRSADGRFAGIIAISVAQEYFAAFHRSLAASAQDSMLLARADGMALARSPALTEAQLSALSPGDSRALLSRFSAGTTQFTSPLDGHERIAAYRRLADYPLYVGYGLGTEPVLRAWHVNLAIYGALALLAAATLFSATWFALRAALHEARTRADLVAEMGRRERAEAALRQAQKMKAVGQLTGGVAHDFNNLLAVVLGNLELLGKHLARRLPDEVRLHRYVEGASEGARRGAALTQRMLAFSRRQELKPEVVDVPGLVRGMADLLTRSLGSQIAIETRFPVRLAPAHVDANGLETALLNLAVNARDAMPRGGALVLAAREEALGLGSPLGLAPGAYVVLSVSDTGEGMDEATLARAAEPFFTTKEVGKGTGLGLAMVHGMAAQSGGTLRLTSRPGAGTTVDLWLPVASGDLAARPIAEPERARTGERCCIVLVVDDDALVRANTVAMLEDLGHRVHETGSGARALALLSAGTPVDLVVTDQIMPAMTGTELAAEVTRRRPGLPVLLASGFTDLAYDEAGGLPRLAKPFTQAALAKAVVSALDAATGATATGDNVVVMPMPAAARDEQRRPRRKG